MHHKKGFADGHFYSPLIDPSELLSRIDQIWPVNPVALGLDFDDDAHEKVLREYFPKFIGDYDYPEHGPSDEELKYFYTQNSQFSWLDSRLLFVLIRALSPKRIVEVGSGYSSVLMADVNHRFFGGAIKVQCIEPFPRAFMKNGLLGIDAVIQKKVQDVNLGVFESLESGDFLFIDSSHVSKTGSDVNFLVFEVLPRLQPGVFVHFHDIFLPLDYPKDWVIDHGRSWNEQYLLHALLMFNATYSIFFGSSYAFLHHNQLVIDAIKHPKGFGFSGGSFWILRNH